MAPKEELDGLPVFLNVYDVSNGTNIQLLNALIAHKNAPFKFGGVFHAGVEIGGREWTFGFCNDGTGVKWRAPRTDPQHHYRETVRLPNTRLSEAEVEKIVQRLCNEYMGATYSLLTRNCCHFAEELCQALGVGSLPAWVHRLHRVGDSLAKVSSNFEGRLGVLCPRSESEQHCGSRAVDVTEVDMKATDGRCLL